MHVLKSYSVLPYFYLFINSIIVQIGKNYTFFQPEQRELQHPRYGAGGFGLARAWNTHKEYPFWLGQLGIRLVRLSAIGDIFLERGESTHVKDVRSREDFKQARFFNHLALGFCHGLGTEVALLGQAEGIGGLRLKFGQTSCEPCGFAVWPNVEWFAKFGLQAK